MKQKKSDSRITAYHCTERGGDCMLELYEHNKAAYRSALELMNKGSGGCGLSGLPTFSVVVRYPKEEIEIAP